MAAQGTRWRMRSHPPAQRRPPASAPPHTHTHVCALPTNTRLCAYKRPRTCGAKPAPSRAAATQAALRSAASTSCRAPRRKRSTAQAFANVRSAVQGRWQSSGNATDVAHWRRWSASSSNTWGEVRGPRERGQGAGDQRQGVDEDGGSRSCAGRVLRVLARLPAAPAAPPARAGRASRRASLAARRRTALGPHTSKCPPPSRTPTWLTTSSCTGALRSCVLDSLRAQPETGGGARVTTARTRWHTTSQDRLHPSIRRVLRGNALPP